MDSMEGGHMLPFALDVQAAARRLCSRLARAFLCHSAAVMISVHAGAGEVYLTEMTMRASAGVSM